MHSFDIFDTLITRKVAVPEGIFAIMQFELGKEEYIDIPISIKNNFYRLRIEAERQARHFYQRNGIEDVTLEQIYDVLAVRGELSEGQCKQLVCLECDIEYRECIPIERNIIQVKKLLSEGKKVILISDMYLPKEQIYKMLEKVDSVLLALPLYVSGDCKKRKRTGAIYKFAMEHSGFLATECIHTGDNEKMDVEAAEKIGFRSNLSWFPDLLPIEKKLLVQTPGSIWLNKVIGCSRLARLKLGREMTQKDAVLVGTSVGGILLCSYMQWVIRTALARGIKRLYFLETDGYMLKRIADILIQKTELVLETYYFRSIDYIKREAIFSDDTVAFVAMYEGYNLERYLLDSSTGYYHIFLFSIDQLIVPDNFSYFVFYPGRIRKRDILEQLCETLAGQTDYESGLEAFTDFFCEDGYMVVQLEDIEQIYRMLTYLETSDEFLQDISNKQNNTL